MERFAPKLARSRTVDFQEVVHSVPIAALDLCEASRPAPHDRRNRHPVARLNRARGTSYPFSRLGFAPAKRGRMRGYFLFDRSASHPSPGSQCSLLATLSRKGRGNFAANPLQSVFRRNLWQS